LQWARDQATLRTPGRLLWVLCSALDRLVRPGRYCLVLHTAHHPGLGSLSPPFPSGRYFPSQRAPASGPALPWVGTLAAGSRIWGIQTEQTTVRRSQYVGSYHHVLLRVRPLLVFLTNFLKAYRKVKSAAISKDRLKVLQFRKIG
jgi:hypothetical protein